MGRAGDVGSWLVNTRAAEGVLLTGVYGSGKSSVAKEIAYLLERRGEPYALLDLDYLSWAGTGSGDRAAEFGLLLQNLATMAANYRRAGIRRRTKTAGRLRGILPDMMRLPAQESSSLAPALVRRR